MMLTKRQILYTTALCVSSLYMSSCTTAQPGVEVRTVTVEKPIQKPCPGTVPTRPAKLEPLPDSPISALALALSKLAEWSAPGKYGDQAQAYFKTCPPAP